MTKKAASSRATARVVPSRKGTTLQMVRLACPDAAQCSLISESFGLPVLDSDGIRDLHEKLIIDAAAALDEGLGERTMQIHLQRIVGSMRICGAVMRREQFVCTRDCRSTCRDTTAERLSAESRQGSACVFAAEDARPSCSTASAVSWRNAC